MRRQITGPRADTRNIWVIDSPTDDTPPATRPVYEVLRTNSRPLADFVLTGCKESVLAAEAARA
jgi:hypothetical protein